MTPDLPVSVSSVVRRNTAEEGGGGIANTDDICDGGIRTSDPGTVSVRGDPAVTRDAPNDCDAAP